MGLRARMSKLEAQAARVGRLVEARTANALPLCVVCFRRGGPDRTGEPETRPVGFHEGGRELVYDDEDQRRELVGARYAAAAYAPLVIIRGMTHVPPPPPDVPPPADADDPT